MHRTFRAVLTAAGAAVIALSGTSPASAAGDITVYAASDDRVDPHATHGGKATFKPYGEHLLITDQSSDGHSAIGLISIGCDSPSCNYYYWNRDGLGSTRDVNLDLAEGTHIGLKACLGEWSGTATGGLMGGTCTSTWKETTA